METPADQPAIDSTTLSWFKASASSDQGACVEVARAPGERVATRDSKDPDGPILTFTTTAWAAFVEDVRADRFTA